MPTIGIPKALLFYDYFPVWNFFWEELGLKIVLSDDTGKKTLDEGINISIEEACLPLKVFLGHVCNLINKKVDYLFIPRYVSVEKKRYLCPKFMGLPDVVRNLIPAAPPLIEYKINYLSGSQGQIVSVQNNVIPIIKEPDLMKIYKRAEGKASLLRKQYDLRKFMSAKKFENQLSIGLLGRPYIINDPYFSMGIKKKLRKYGVRVLTSKSLSSEEINIGASLLKKRIFWSMGNELVGTGLAMLINKYIDGAIFILSFGCGPDSLLVSMVERFYKDAGVPLLCITLDEHAGEAGLITRLEAFLDMIMWRKEANEDNFSPYGDSLDSLKNIVYTSG